MITSSYEHTIIWSYDHMIIWPHDHMITSSQYNHMIIWSHDHHIITWLLDHMIIWLQDHLTIPYVYMIICPCGHMITWPLDHMIMWSQGHLTIWSYDHMVTGRHGVDPGSTLGRPWVHPLRQFIMFYTFFIFRPTLRYSSQIPLLPPRRQPRRPRSDPSSLSHSFTHTRLIFYTPLITHMVWLRSRYSTKWGVLMG